LRDIIIILLEQVQYRGVRAVFLPIPGSLANSLTAFSRSEEENCMLYKDKPNPDPSQEKATITPTSHDLISKTRWKINWIEHSDTFFLGRAGGGLYIKLVFPI
jgi:hypothetical protein